MLIPLLLTRQAPAFVTTSVQAFGLYAGDVTYPASDVSFRTGTMVIVRRTQADGATVSDLRTFPVAGRTMALRSVSSGRIVRDSKGNVTHIEVSVRSADPRFGNEGSSVWDRQEGDEGGLRGWSESAWEGRHPVMLKDGGFYSLGALEALTYDPKRTLWRVPAPSDTHIVSLGIARSGAPYNEYAVGEGVVGDFWYEGRKVELRVCPVFLKGYEHISTTVNGRSVDDQHTSVALFDRSGRVVGFGNRGEVPGDVDSQDWSGKTGRIVAPPAFPTAPSPFRTFSVGSFAAPVELSPSEQAAVLRNL